MNIKIPVDPAASIASLENSKNIKPNENKVDSISLFLESGIGENNFYCLFDSY
jgi:hypothetical protein